MKESAYKQILDYLKRANRPISPQELAIKLAKSRVTIQSSLKRLVENGWVQKQGSSPKAYYIAVDPFNQQEPATMPNLIPTDVHSIEAYIAWCKTHRYHIPETILEYQHWLKVSQK